MSGRHQNNEIVIYETEDGAVSLEVNVENDTVWLTQEQLSVLFDRSLSSISRHIKNALDEGEIDEKSNLQKMQIAWSDKPVILYNLDVIISVGYRVKSQRGVQFRRWATSILKDYMLKGYAANERRLEQLEQIVRVLARTDNEIASGIANVVSHYLPGLEILRDYDAEGLDPHPRTTPSWILTADEVRSIIQELRLSFPDDSLLGLERGDDIERILGAIYQGFGDQDVYPTVEEKAANLLYFVIKDHPFTDGNKRTAAALFVTFLAKNGLTHSRNNEALVTNNTLAALTLLIANSNPREKELMIDLTMRML